MVNNPPVTPSDSEPAKKPRAPKIVVKLSSVAKSAPSALRKATRILTPVPALEPPPLPRVLAVTATPAVPAPAHFLPPLPPQVSQLPLPVLVPEKKPVTLAPPKVLPFLGEKPAKSIFDEVPADRAEEPATPLGWKSLEAGELPVELSELDPFATLTVEELPAQVELKAEPPVPAPLLIPVRPQRKTAQVKLPDSPPAQQLELLQPMVAPPATPPTEVNAELFLQPTQDKIAEPAKVLVEPTQVITPVPALLPLKKEAAPKKRLGKLFSKAPTAPPLIPTVPPLDSARTEAKAIAPLLPAPKKKGLGGLFGKVQAASPLIPPVPPLEAAVIQAKAPVPVLPVVEKSTLKPASLAPQQKSQKVPRKLEPPPVTKRAPVVEELPPVVKTEGLAALETLPLPRTSPPPEDTAEKRAARIRRKHLTETVVFYAVTAVICGGLYYGSISWFPETRLEGQVIPPPGMSLGNEAWIVEDFSSLALGVADDLAGDRAPRLQEIGERRDALQRVRADIAGREERITLLQQQIQSARDEITSVVKDAHDQVQAIWDGAGVQLEKAYDGQLAGVEKTIKDRAAQLKLNYQPNAEYRSPEVWANAYRLALYQPPSGVDAVKEHAWIEDQLKKWRDFTKSLDGQQKQLRDQAAQIQASPSAKVDDLKAQIDDLQHKVDDATTDELPLKRELEEDQSSLGKILAEESTLDGRYYQELSTLPKSSIIGQLRFQLSSQGRFSWKHVEKDAAFTPEKKEHQYYIFFRAMRADGREFWSLQPFTVQKDVRTKLIVLPSSFLSTQAILRPDLPPDEP